VTPYFTGEKGGWKIECLFSGEEGKKGKKPYQVGTYITIRKKIGGVSEKRKARGGGDF